MTKEEKQDALLEAAEIVNMGSGRYSCNTLKYYLDDYLPHDLQELCKGYADFFGFDDTESVYPTLEYPDLEHQFVRSLCLLLYREVIND